MKKKYCWIFSLALAAPLCAATAQDAEPTLPQPPTARELEEGLPGSQITIIRREHDVVEEFRLNGRLYMVRITPNRGRPYYLIDTTGDGLLDARREIFDASTTVNRWRLFSW